MEFTLKGNYFRNRYTLASIGGLKGVEKFFEKFSPADIKKHLWTCPIEYRHIEPAIESASKGFDIWKRVTFTERINSLKKAKSKIQENRDLIAESISWETGKPLWESYEEIDAVISKVEITVTHSLPRVEDKLITLDQQASGYLYYRPVGITLIMGPATMPVQVIGSQMISALLGGSSVIVKPALETCHSSQMLIDCFIAAGFPEGVINLLQGDRELIRRLLCEKAIKTIFFTGARETGKSILEAAAQDITKIVSLGLGSKNCSIIDKDVSIDNIAPKFIQAAFKSAGQRCTSTSLVAIHSSIASQFIEKFHQLAKNISIDHPINNSKAFMGPLINKIAYDNYLTYMGMAKREGLEEIMRGKALDRTPAGYYVSPSIHLTDNFDPQSHFLANEIVGPNCTFIAYNSIEEAVAIANGTEFGLSASYFGKNRDHQRYCMDNVQTGQFFINRSTIDTDQRLPFGGIKNSGNYHPGGICAIDSCVYTQTVIVNEG